MALRPAFQRILFAPSVRNESQADCSFFVIVEHPSRNGAVAEGSGYNVAFFRDSAVEYRMLRMAARNGAVTEGSGYDVAFFRDSAVEYCMLRMAARNGAVTEGSGYSVAFSVILL